MTVNQAIQRVLEVRARGGVDLFSAVEALDDAVKSIPSGDFEVVHGLLDELPVEAIGEDRAEVAICDFEMKDLVWVIVTVTARGARSSLNEMDVNIGGQYRYVVAREGAEDTALTAFHSLVAIRVLDDFDITTEVI